MVLLLVPTTANSAWPRGSQLVHLDRHWLICSNHARIMLRTLESLVFGEKHADIQVCFAHKTPKV